MLDLEIGEISEPLEIFGSLYIVQVLERIEARPLSLEEVKPYIEEILADEQHAALAADLQKQLMTEANVTIYQGVLETYFKNNTE